MHIYDYIIIGSGLTGLTIANKIQQETDNILVLEAQDVSGGDNRPATLNSHLINNGLRFYPATEASQKALAFVEALAEQSIAQAAHENTIETYEASGFKKFMGFGDKSPEFYEQLSYFLSPEEIELNTQPHQWTTALTEKLGDKIQNRSIVTKLGFEGLDSEKPQLTHVIVNGTKQIYAQNFIFAAAAKELGLLVPDDVLNVRAKAKLKKSVGWQGVCLDLFHTTALEKTNLFLLNGTTDDELGPCIGRFIQSSTTAEGQISQWMSFIDSEYAEDTENIGLVLKKMKRQIKRAFPELAETIKKERIFVTPALSGSDLKLNANGTLPKVENLWVASSQMSPYQNLVGSLMQAQLVLSALGFVSSVTTEETAPELNA
jgi:hypothetical protein